MQAQHVMRAPRKPALLGCLAVLLALAPTDEATGQPAGQGALDAVVSVTAHVPGSARTASSLGTERAGSGVVIDDSGLVVTIGYLIMEASEVEISAPSSDDAIPATIVAYDPESGFGLVRASRDLEVAPIPLGDSDGLARMQPLLAVSRVGELHPAGVFVLDRREFAGYWEYLLEDAIFTAPPQAEFGGAALLDENGALVGIGSLLVPDAGALGRPVPGNMFVPVNELKPILGDLLADGHRADPPRPWLGVSVEEHRGRVFVTRVSPDGPAAAAGIEPDDLIVGVGGDRVASLAELYRKVWALGDAGVEVPLDLLKEVEVIETPVRSADRYRWLRLDPSF